MPEWIDLNHKGTRKCFMRLKLSLLFSFLFSINSFSQSREYAVKVIGIRVGTIWATKTVEGQNATYKLSSDVNVNFLVYRLKVDYKVKSTLDSTGLLNSEVNVVSNRGNCHTKTIKADVGFKATSHQPDKEVNKKIEHDIEATFASIFFNEPTDIPQVYAEFYADFIDIEKIEDGKYRGVIDKNTDEFYYENGLLVKLVKKNPITDMVIEYQAPVNKIAR